MGSGRILPAPHGAATGIGPGWEGTGTDSTGQGREQHGQHREQHRGRVPEHRVPASSAVVRGHPIVPGRPSLWGELPTIYWLGRN